MPSRLEPGRWCTDWDGEIDGSGRSKLLEAKQLQIEPLEFNCDVGFGCVVSCQSREPLKVSSLVGLIDLVRKAMAVRSNQLVLYEDFCWDYLVSGRKAMRGWSWAEIGNWASANRSSRITLTPFSFLCGGWCHIMKVCVCGCE